MERKSNTGSLSLEVINLDAGIITLSSISFHVFALFFTQGTGSCFIIFSSAAPHGAAQNPDSFLAPD